ncbi:voltage-dependent N-type calcium channel subunit alpha-1B-like [Betta splendens]|uniref:Voltage-dependent N-type calcium channel subunit alpha-1B-like n=1 Tax=Betta splendens TaxID=158456 RepID=A0A8M1H7X7_BETSP|nr:voltage-dependent N-type calcium channel subunit alpha-1B-like [Betta splendens]
MDLLVTPHKPNELTVGKVYAALMIFDNYKQNRARRLQLQCVLGSQEKDLPPMISNSVKPPRMLQHQPASNARSQPQIRLSASSLDNRSTMQDHDCSIRVLSSWMTEKQSNAPATDTGSRGPSEHFMDNAVNQIQEQMKTKEPGGNSTAVTAFCLDQARAISMPRLSAELQF